MFVFWRKSKTSKTLSKLSDLWQSNLNISNFSFAQKPLHRGRWTENNSNKKSLFFKFYQILKGVYAPNLFQTCFMVANNDLKGITTYLTGFYNRTISGPIRTELNWAEYWHLQNISNIFSYEQSFGALAVNTFYS